MSYTLGYTDRLILVPISQWQVPFNQPFLSASKSGTLILNERYRRITPSRKHWFSNRIFLRNALRPMNHLKLTYSKNDQNRSKIILHVYVRSLMWKFDKNIPKGSVLDLNNQWQFFNCHSSTVTTQRLFHINCKNTEEPFHNVSCVYPKNWGQELCLQTTTTTPNDNTDRQFMIKVRLNVLVTLHPTENTLCVLISWWMINYYPKNNTCVFEQCCHYSPKQKWDILSLVLSVVLQ